LKVIEANKQAGVAKREADFAKTIAVDEKCGAAIRMRIQRQSR
jgi:hypothetical protein